jgi:hypothetical protein
MINLKKTGNPVFPITMKNDPTTKINVDLLKIFIESYVTVNPKSLNEDCAVKHAHQLGDTP